MKMKTTILVVATLILTAGCVTTSQSKSEYQAQIAGLQAENTAYQSRLAAIEEVRRSIREQYELLFMEWQRSEGRRSHKPQ